MIYIRADGNAEIGTGHVMRCLSIACAARNKGISCMFIVADENMVSLLEKQGFRYICLNSVWNDLDRETDQMEVLIRRENIRLLLVDSYFVTPDYLSRLHQITHVAYMDDLNAFTYPCSTLINYNLYAQQLYSSEQYSNTRLLVGPKYAPLREEFQNIPRRIVREHAKAVLVTTGGSDPMNIAGKIVRMAKECPDTSKLIFHIVAGRFNQNLAVLEQLETEYSGITIHSDVPHMSELMQACDIAVSAGGSTMYELCACGTPTVCYALADNQLNGVESFQRYLFSAGDIRQDAEQQVRRILRYIVQLCSDRELRESQSSCMQGLVDGDGAGHIAEYFIAVEK